MADKTNHGLAGAHYSVEGRRARIADEKAELHEMELAAMPVDELVAKALAVVEAFVARKEKIRQLSRDGVAARQSTATARKILRRYVDAKTRGTWSRESASKLAHSLDCTAHRVRQVVADFEKNHVSEN